MKHFKFAVLLIPLVFIVLAVTGYGFIYRAAVSVSCAIIVWFMSERSTNSSILWIVAALLISIAGDWFLSHVRGVPVRFIYGVCLFFVAHIGFLCFCLKNGRMNRYVLSFVLTGYLIFFFVMLRPALMSDTILFIAVLAYLLISCFSLVAAVGLRLSLMTRLCFSLGIALLVFSDTLIALKNFAGHAELKSLILPTYFASHLFITLSLIRR